MATVRICICGDESVGKSSLLTTLVRDTLPTSPPLPVLPPITIPPSLLTPENITTTLVDTSALPADRDALKRELRKANCILLVYSDHYSYERVALFWLPLFRALGCNVPVVLCANKSDLSGGAKEGNDGVGGAGGATTAEVIAEEMLPVMAEFKEIDSCIRTSALAHHNVNEVFFLCQKAVTHPIAPLYDSKEGALKPAAVEALKRVFYLCDRDQDGILNDKEVGEFQRRCFEKDLSAEDLGSIKKMIGRERAVVNGGEHGNGIDLEGFLLLNRMFAEKGRHETIWIILRKFNYTDSLSLKDTFLHPKFDVPANASAELSPAGYRFFVDLFLLHDKDNDGGLNDSELATLFAPTPGLPQSWTASNFPSTTVRNEAGHITLQGWLAQWSMTTFEEPRTTLAYLAYLNFESAPTTSALKVTKPRNRSRTAKIERTVLLCYVVGAPGAGKNSLLDAFLSRPSSTQQPFHSAAKSIDTTLATSTPPYARRAVNSVELPGGKQIYLILSLLPIPAPTIPAQPNPQDTLTQTPLTLPQPPDLIAYTYDSSDPDSFSHVASLLATSQHLTSIPAVFAALKADKDRAVQRGEVSPERFCEDLGVPGPRHVSVRWESVGEFFGALGEVGTVPGLGIGGKGKGKGGREEGVGVAWWVAGVGAAIGVGVVGFWGWRRWVVGTE